MSAPAQRPAPLERKVCPDCGIAYYSEGWHAENCTGPRHLRPVELCRRTIRRPGGMRGVCWKPAGHGGQCG